MIIDLINKIVGFPSNMIEKIVKWVFSGKTKEKKVKSVGGLEEVKGPIKEGRLITVFENEPKKRTNMPGHRNPPPPPPKDRRSPYYTSGTSGTKGGNGTAGYYSLFDKLRDSIG